MQEPMNEFGNSAIGEHYINELLSGSSEDLYHWGIKGMKWGVRRYQNKDGTRTPAGLKRYATKVKDSIDKRKSKKAAEKLRKKPIGELTDDELKFRIERAQRERQLFELERPMSSLNKEHINLGKQFLINAGQKVIGPAMVDAGRNLLTKFLNDRIGNALGLNGKDVEDALKGLKQEVAELGLIKQKKELTDYLNGSKPKDDLDGLAKSAKEWGYRKTIAEGKQAEGRLKTQSNGGEDNHSSSNSSNTNARRVFRRAKSSGSYTLKPKVTVSDSLSQKMADEAAKYIPSNSHASVSELYRKTFPDEYWMTKVEDLEDYRKWTK